MNDYKHYQGRYRHLARAISRLIRYSWVGTLAGGHQDWVGAAVRAASVGVR
jgi:hypothetical protein